MYDILRLSADNFLVRPDVDMTNPQDTCTEVMGRTPKNDNRHRGSVIGVAQITMATRGDRIQLVFNFCTPNIFRRG
jgi:hypothetical protein